MNRNDWTCKWGEEHIEIQNTTDFFNVNSAGEPVSLKSTYVITDNMAVFLADVGDLDIEKCTAIIQELTNGGDDNGGQ